MRLARWTCPRVEFGLMNADPALKPWSELPALQLVLAEGGGAPKQGTSVRTAHDGTVWRTLFICEDTDPWATLTGRDAPLYTEETVEIFCDPVGDLETYFEIETNPKGALLDLVFRRSRSGYKGDSAWDCEGLRAAVDVRPGLWVAELEVPLGALVASPAREWRVNFCRIDRPSRDGSIPRELSAWSPPMRGTFHTPERFGVLEFEKK